MKVLVKDRSISTSKGIVKIGDEVDLPETEVKKIMVLKPKDFDILKIFLVFKFFNLISLPTTFFLFLYVG